MILHFIQKLRQEFRLFLCWLRRRENCLHTSFVAVQKHMPFMFCFVLYLTLFKTMYHTVLGKYQGSLILRPLPQESKFTFPVLFLVAVIISAVLLHVLSLSSRY